MFHKNQVIVVRLYRVVYNASGVYIVGGVQASSKYQWRGEVSGVPTVPTSHQSVSSSAPPTPTATNINDGQSKILCSYS